MQTTLLFLIYLYISIGDTPESFGKFCYLVDMHNADGEVYLMVAARVRPAGKNFRELSLFSSFKTALLKALKPRKKSRGAVSEAAWSMEVGHGQ